MDDEGRKLGLIERMNLYHNRKRLSDLVFFVGMEGLTLLLGYVAVHDKFQKGEFDEAIVYGAITATLMGGIGWLGIKSYLSAKLK